MMAEFLEALKRRGNDPNKLQSDVGVARGETPGTVSSDLPSSQEELAPYDRFAQFAGESNPIAKYTNLIGAPLIAGGYEAAKLSPGLMNNVIAPIAGDSFKMDETTSSPSLKNILAAAMGAKYAAFGR
jgi:hypothetical protein